MSTNFVYTFFGRHLVYDKSLRRHESERCSLLSAKPALSIQQHTNHFWTAVQKWY